MPVFVTFVTAGYPKSDMTVDIMLAMEAGGADVIELGVPFSDPIADGPAIQESNVVRHFKVVFEVQSQAKLSRLKSVNRLLWIKMSIYRKC